MKKEGNPTRARLYIGTSGWAYGHWRQIFYPESLPAKDRLKYYARHFRTTEINYSFYHLPRPATYLKWFSETPEGFVFAVKVSRLITHVKKLGDVREAWAKFIEQALNLREKLGPLLFQFPPSFQAEGEGYQRLKDFLSSKPGQNLRFAFEFRHKSWCNQQIYDLLKEHNAAWVIADSSRYPKAKSITADFVYIRMHGPKAMFSSLYSGEELDELTQEIKLWLSSGLDVYVYFNNDFHGFAIANARELVLKLEGYSPRQRSLLK